MACVDRPASARRGHTYTLDVARSVGDLFEIINHLWCRGVVRFGKKVFNSDLSAVRGTQHAGSLKLSTHLSDLEAPNNCPRSPLSFSKVRESTLAPWIRTLDTTPSRRPVGAVHDRTREPYRAVPTPSTPGRTSECIPGFRDPPSWTLGRRPLRGVAILCLGRLPRPPEIANSAPHAATLGRGRARPRLSQCRDPINPTARPRRARPR